MKQEEQTLNSLHDLLYTVYSRI